MSRVTLVYNKQKSKTFSSDCKYGISFIHKDLFSLLFAFETGSIPILKFSG